MLPLIVGQSAAQPDIVPTLNGAAPNVADAEIVEETAFGKQ